MFATISRQKYIIIVALIASSIFFLQYRQQYDNLKQIVCMNNGKDISHRLWNDQDFHNYFAGKSPENIDLEEIFRYLHWENKTSCYVSVPFGGYLDKWRTSFVHDGQKEVCTDPGVAPEENRCLIYSFGINNEWSYDEAMEKIGCDVFSFDPSMGREDHKHSSKIHFFNLGLSNKDTIEKNSTWKMKTLSSIYKNLTSIHGERNIDQLKMDIEFYEWLAIPQMIESEILSKVKQIAVEIHLKLDDNLETFRKYYRILRLLEESGFYRFTSHHNPGLQGTVLLLNKTENIGYEITWYNEKFRKI